MQRNALTLVLLSAFLFGLVAMPHPCREMQAGERMSGHSSCHQTAPAPGPTVAKGALSAGTQNDCGIACQHACHMVAVLSIEPVRSAIAPLSRQPHEKPDRIVPPVAFQIDHIPLA